MKRPQKITLRVLQTSVFPRKAHDELANCQYTGQVMRYIDRMKHIAFKLPNTIDNELFDRFVRGYIKL